MKKTIITLLAILVCSIMPMQAYEYFTIYFSDGTKSNAFYATDVDSICYSKIGLDSIEYADWQVQEIYTCDSIYRYSLAQIDSLSFKDVDENLIAERIAKVSKSVLPIYAQCNSISEIVPYIPLLNQIEGVEKAWTDIQTLFVKVKDWSTLFFYYPDESIQSDTSFTSASRAVETKSDDEARPHIPIDAKSICIVYQMANAHQFEETVDKKNLKEECLNLKKECEKWGLETFFNDAPSPDFFVEDIFDYDLVFINTHGCYDSYEKLHWLITGEKIGESEEVSSFDDLTDEFIDKSLSDAIFNKFDSMHPYALEGYISFYYTKEKQENEKWKIVWYTMISEKLIGYSPCKFKDPGRAIVFNSACQSLKGDEGKDNYSLAKVFENKGAGCYLGYNNTNTVGIEAGCSFFIELLNGKCVESAFMSLPESQRIEIRKDTALLKMLPNNSSFCISAPVTFGCITVGESNYKLLGCIKILNNQESVSSYRYGFLLSTSSAMLQPDTIKAENNYDDGTLYMNWEKTFDVRNLQPNTTYYYCAYMNDGYSDCYGEVKSFTTENIEAYAVLNDGTLTFYYDGKMNERIGGVIKISFFYNKYQQFESWYDDVYVVDFDPSFYYYTPWRTYCWFNLFHNLTEVRNIKWLNTSKTADMTWMFASCNSLKSLDLRSFDTSNVISMKCMFENCNSLTYLDISSFDTHNVTNMWGMFDGCCSLPSIDVSNFDTSNVIEMPAMFKDCSSIRSLDLSHFKVSSDTNINGMFAYSSSLTTIYAGNWNAGTLSANMFEHCDNLVGGRGTKVGWNYYIDENGEQRSYYCFTNGSSAHIDGGKDNPGLFTAK